MIETAMTGIGRVNRADDAFRHKGQALRSLERGTRRILSHDTSVEQRFPHVLLQFSVHFSTLTAYHNTGIVSRRTNHTEHLTRRGFYGNDTTYLPFHQSFAQSLQVDVNTQRQVLSCHRLTVEGSVLVFAFDCTMHIPQQYLNTLLTTQLFLVVTLHTQFTDIVTRDIVVVGLDIFWRHLSHVA